MELLLLAEPKIQRDGHFFSPRLVEIGVGERTPAFESRSLFQEVIEVPHLSKREIHSNLANVHVKCLPQYPEGYREAKKQGIGRDGSL